MIAIRALPLKSPPPPVPLPSSMRDNFRKGMRQNIKQDLAHTDDTNPRAPQGPNQGPNLAGRHILALAVGNSRTRVGLFTGNELSEVRAVSSADAPQVLAAARDAIRDHAGVVAVMSSVNAPAADRIESALESDLDEVFRIGRDIHVPMRHTLDDASTLGQDRILCALAAYTRAQQACVIIDAGTAITVDFVDGEGVFHGGVIAPGLRMMLDSLHNNTAALPKLDWSPPDPARGPFGKDTAHAMLLGVRASAIGLARHVTEVFAETYEAYPQIVATGGDAPALFENDPIVEHIVPDLQLIGILEACKAALMAEGDFDDPDPQHEDRV
jgi:type III pantothenate kinase